MRNFARRALLGIILLLSLTLSGSAGEWNIYKILPLALEAILILIIYAWGKELVGRWWALLPAFLIAFSPALLYGASGDGSDIAKSIAINASLLSLLGMLASPSAQKIIIASATLGVGITLTPDAITLLPVLVAATTLYYFTAKQRRFGQLFAAIAAAIAVTIGLDMILGLDATKIFELSETGIGWGSAIKSIILREPLPSLLLIAFSLTSLLGRGIISFFKIALRKHVGVREYLEMRVNETAMLMLIFFWIRKLALDAEFEAQSALTILPSVYILAVSAVRRYFSLDEVRKAKNVMLKIFVLHEELIKLSIKSLLLAAVVFSYLITALIAAPDFAEYQNILKKIFSGN